MKTVLGLVLLIGNFVFADQWPYDPICRRYNASSETVKIIGVSDPVVLCKFGAGSYIDKGSLPVSVGSFETLAVRSYKQNTNEPFGRHCTEYGAAYRRAVASNGRTFSVCYFFDRSVMEEQTFLMGPESAFNTEMNQALGLPWGPLQN